MARDAGKAVNLHWSPARWREEHNRLSRWKTLQQLAAQRQVYDLDYFEALLPDQWPGYLIRSSRRLGMEGLRQRHCVASYDSQVRLGRCAIAVVFVDRKRYTVELRQVSAKQPIAIVQVKGRYNRVPTEDVKQQISDCLGVPYDSRTQSMFRPRDPANQEREALDALRQVLPRLQAEGITKVVVHFDGSGDSGMIEDPDFYRGNDLVQAAECGLETADREALDQAFESYLDSTGVDWYNNDGGYGEFMLDVATGQLTAEVNARYTDSNCEHFAEIDLIDAPDNQADAA